MRTTALGLALAAVPAAARPFAPRGLPDTAGSGSAPPFGSVVQGAGRPWIEREYLPAGRAPAVCAWQCPASGAALLVADGAVRLDEPGWGQRWFRFAEFREGHPQAAVRRLFGAGVVEELERAVAAQLA
jgi:hypothetical protein